MLVAGHRGLGTCRPYTWLRCDQSRRVSTRLTSAAGRLTLISNSLKAGFGLMQALDLASREMPHPMAHRAEADACTTSTSVRAPKKRCCNLAKRCGSDDLDIVVTAMIIQQSTGGNLAEILDNVAHTMRERIRIRGEIKTLTTQQMMTGFVIGGLPFVDRWSSSLMNPDYMKPLFTDDHRLRDDGRRRRPRVLRRDADQEDPGRSRFRACF